MLRIMDKLEMYKKKKKLYTSGAIRILVFGLCLFESIRVLMNRAMGVSGVLLQ